jgi:cytochrome c peroxidase
LNPVEQASRKKKVCQRVKTAPYKEFYRQAYETPIDCRKQSLDESYARVVLAVAAFEHSDKVNPFSSVREECLADDDGDGTIQGCSVDIMSEDAKAGHDLFYSFGGGAACSGCHNNLDEDFAGVNPNTEKNTYTDHSYHYLGVPYNRRIGYARGSDTGLNQHVTDPTLGIIPGEFKTPSLLNQAKGEEYTTYMHNGYFKTLKQVMHFYNTGTTKYCKDATEASAGDDWEEINARGLNTEFAWLNATIEEVWMEEGEDFQDNSDNVDDSYALCWPEPEFSRVDIPGIVGDRGLTPLQEDQVVAYLRALDDGDFVGFLADETSQATSGPPRGRGRR